MSSAALTRGTAKIVTVNQGGGSKKAGILSSGGRSQFAMRAITHGHTHPASTFIPNPYPISGANQLGGIGRGTTGGMTRTPADGVDALERSKMQLSVNGWNQVWPAMPIRGTPNASRSIPFSYYNPGEKFTPIKNITLVNAANQKAQINVSGPVTVAIPDGGGTGIANVVGNGPGRPGTISVGNAITESLATAP